MLGIPNRLGARSPLAALAARFGFRRVERVHVVLAGGVPAARVTGIVHRYPRTVPVSIDVAAQLVRAGAHLTIERVDADRSPG